MRLRGEFTNKEIKEWMKDRDNACKSCNVKTFRQFYSKWMLRGMYFKELPADDMVIEIMMRKMIYNIREFTPREKEEAKKWLEAHGCDTRL